MSVHFNDIVKQGYVRFRSKKLGVWQKRWVIFKKASSKGPRRLEKYPEERQAVTGQQAKWIELTSVKSVARLPSDVRKFAVSIYFYDGSSRCFACESGIEANEWDKILKDECMKGPPSISGVDLLDAGVNVDARELERFHVCVLPSMKLDLHGECLMQITPEKLILYDISEPRRRLVTWPLNCLRRYGRDESKFTFESGRHCDTGEGLFIFNTLEGEKIYQRVHQATLHIAEAHRIFNWQQQQMGKSPLGQSRSLPNSPGFAADISPVPTIERGARRSMPLPPIPRPGNMPPEPPPRPNCRSAREKPLPQLPEESYRAIMDDAKDSDDSDSDREDFPTSPSMKSPLPGMTLDETINDADEEQVRFEDTGGATSQMTTNPLRVMVPTSAENNNGDLEYIYEEKHFTSEFRNFLKTRKEDNNNTEMSQD